VDNDDWVTVSNAANLAGIVPGLIGRYCTANPPPTVISSTGNTLAIRFHSDSDNTVGTGFVANVQFVS
jgi:hypothetical protein